MHIMRMLARPAVRMQLSAQRPQSNMLSLNCEHTGLTIHLAARTQAATAPGCARCANRTGHLLCSNMSSNTVDTNTALHLAGRTKHSDCA
jgi:hypothetical protein